MTLENMILNKYHISTGIPTDPTCCPVASTIKEHIDISDVYVEPGYIEFITHSKTNIDYKTSKKLTQWIEAYDDGKPVSELELFINEDNELDCTLIGSTMEYINQSWTEIN